MKRSRIPSPSGRRGARGFTLLEVLIALLVLGFGLLGMALLQTMNLRFTQSANYRTQATILAYDLLDQIRANRLLAPEYVAINPGSFAGVTGKGCTVGSDKAIKVEDSMKRWRCQLVGALGEGANALVAYGADGAVTVRVTWKDQRWSTDSERFFDVGTQL